MSNVNYVDRRGTNSAKWDGMMNMFGEEGLHAMWVADMDFQVPSCVTDALKSYVEQGVFGYYSIPESYYDSFMNWEKTYHNYEVHRDWIRFSPGVVSAFNWIVQFMTKPKDAVIVLTPVYYPFLNAVKDNDRTLIMCDLVNKNGTYQVDFADFEKKIIENEVKLFILSSPHNPVGRVWTRDELEKMIEICRRHHVFIIADEIHHDLVFADNQHIPLASVGKNDDMIITVTAPSKTFNLAGCQNSIIIVPDESLREKWDHFAHGIRLENGNAFGYIAAEAAYTHGRPWLEEVKEIIYSNFLYMKETLESLKPGIRVSPLEGTYLAWIDLGNYVKAEELHDFMQKKCGLALDYGEWFGGDRFGTFVRMNLATSRESVEYGVNALITQLGN